MASLKQEYGEVLDFYFIEFNDERSKYIAEDFEIARHPETVLLAPDNTTLLKVQGYNEGMETDLRNAVKQLKELFNEPQ